jgi:hypothetical protein
MFRKRFSEVMQQITLFVPARNANTIRVLAKARGLSQRELLRTWLAEKIAEETEQSAAAA